MGKCDVALAQYFEDEYRYADLINAYIFNGRQIVKAEDIVSGNPVINGLLGRFKEWVTIQKYRDAVRKIIFGMNFIIVGLEHQNLIHYGMPVRIMLEDAAGYDEQLRTLQRQNRRLKKLSSKEFLGGIRKEDRLKAVFTIVLYYGTEPWRGAGSLYEMLDLTGIPEEIRGMLNNYRIHILEVRHFEKTERFRTDLREVFGFIQKVADKNAAKRFTFQNEERFKELAEDAYDVISALTESRELEEVKERYREKGGKINMCEAIRGMIEDGRMEGLSEGLSEGIKTGEAMGIIRGDENRSVITAKNMYDRGFSAEDAAGMIGIDCSRVQEWYRKWGNGVH